MKSEIFNWFWCETKVFSVLRFKLPANLHNIDLIKKSGLRTGILEAKEKSPEPQILLKSREKREGEERERERENAFLYYYRKTLILIKITLAFMYPYYGYEKYRKMRRSLLLLDRRHW